ncbi:MULTISPECIES: DUF4148 domain-containing protein [Caballeronia]|uniref:Purine nucleoside phosphorylase n=1 Tax=Caballeronia zhejiangensis TaxID=871203 RepID=A0A656QB47_9BURK|nr:MULTISPECIES: DUF4148 domain-containing protein [Caballeronia]EKS71680.1 hypothetical protein BURK_007566 [Burkholderia sp. SJ98]KDR26204.1 hypothetical protein BG60_24060 [Caballeronia zhejiangensis]MCE4547899.1 DUF4148 domain-containing protein [Caballeronia sp. PC1]MCE4548118.1 DUF4148 domain-containing protein [Caballeronia sp. PC1]MCE4575773.1 DUF4148 domain-containing protein [Caballeronia sp. CLC5]
MKLLLTSIIVATLASPIASIAQTAQPQLSRAQVRADLRQIEQAGYNPARRDDVSYPADIQAAEMRVAARDGLDGGRSSMGGAPTSTSESGHATANHGRNSLFSHH